ncbi:MAG: hypothetical protein ACI9BC_000602, partial [Crocinitomicaceae bacterium]
MNIGKKQLSQQATSNRALTSKLFKRLMSQDSIASSSVAGSSLTRGYRYAQR